MNSDHQIKQLMQKELRNQIIASGMCYICRHAWISHQIRLLLAALWNVTAEYASPKGLKTEVLS
jgi:hypothetical protein